MTKRLAALLFLAALLCGCSGLRLVDSSVQATSTLPADSSALVGAHYRFERLPSQAAQPQFPRIEALADAALARAGLVRDETSARYSVLVGVRVESFFSDPWGLPLTDPWWPGAYGGYRHLSYGGGWGMGLDYYYPPRESYRREVSLVLRDLHSGQVVYETQAAHDGPWSDTDQVLAAMFDAALKDFPHPPPGTRRINIEIPR